jgi:hypothetical protein
MSNPSSSLVLPFFSPNAICARERERSEKGDTSSWLMDWGRGFDKKRRKRYAGVRIWYAKKGTTKGTKKESKIKRERQERKGRSSERKRDRETRKRNRIEGQVGSDTIKMET